MLADLCEKVATVDGKLDSVIENQRASLYSCKDCKKAFESDIDELKTNVTTLKTKSTVYGGIGGIVCGAIAAGVVSVIVSNV